MNRLYELPFPPFPLPTLGVRGNPKKAQRQGYQRKSAQAHSSHISDWKPNMTGSLPKAEMPLSILGATTDIQHLNCNCIIAKLLTK